VVGIARRQVHLVRRGDPVLRRVPERGQLVHVVPTLPLVPSVPGHRKHAIPIRADRHPACGLPADGAIRVGIHLVLSRCAPPAHGADEGVAGRRRHVFHTSQVRRHAWFEPSGPNRERGAPVRILVGDRAVSSPPQLHGHLAVAGDRHRFGHARHQLPPAFVPVLVRLIGVRAVDVQVLLVDGEDCEPEGYTSVVPDRDPRQGRFAGADHIQAWRRKVRDVAQRRHADPAVRIVGEQRAAGSGPAGADDPVVAAFRIDAGGNAHRAGPNHWRRRGQAVHAQHIVGDHREVESHRHRHSAGRLADPAKVLDLWSIVAQGQRAGNFLLEV